VISHAFTAYPLAAAGLVRAIASLGIPAFIAFHRTYIIYKKKDLSITKPYP
jgi:hypothetical protein